VDSLVKGWLGDLMREAVGQHKLTRIAVVAGVSVNSALLLWMTWVCFVGDAA
jgi:hypothetical protein